MAGQMRMTTVGVGFLLAACRGEFERAMGLGSGGRWGGSLGIVSDRLETLLFSQGARGITSGEYRESWVRLGADI
jgi:hypothetical protein